MQKYHNYIKHIENEYKYILLTYLITIKKQGTKSAGHIVSEFYQFITPGFNGQVFAKKREIMKETQNEQWI